ncbi:sialin-like [Chrysoperla carnea]|uniref:sialin-like n=1 Tax=Chrysoperla carnea TaxID=189513 RepID=UPI001D08E8FF|nr:sialin-like [Chrysoperla carnea]XP_044739525.1 sialin-like [Chrysoperla carnea]XP_044739526.1 sialin-like [Chrysoperla carnea]
MCLPTRVVIGVQFFLACLISYMLRVNLSVNIVAMIVQKPRPPTETECALVNGTNGLNPDFGPRYLWDNQIQGIILGAYYWGYIPTCVLGGYLAETFSATKVITISMFVSAILTALSPYAASVHFSFLIIIRLLLGTAGGVVYPCLHSMLAKWVPPKEKGRFMTALMGGTFGTVVTWSCVGYIIEFYGWVWAFYIPALITTLCGLLWYFTVFDTPELHTRISEEEREYILKSMGSNISHNKRRAPYEKIVKSVPFWALVTLHVGNSWGLYFMLTVGPKFLSEVLGFNLRNSGVLSSLPSTARFVCAFIFGYFGDMIRQRELMQTTVIRKTFCLFSHIIPGFLLLCLLFTGCDHNWAVALLTVSQGFNGASTVTNLQNAQDIAPNFAGSLYGFMNSFGSIAGILTPMITGQITKHNNDIQSWHIVFSIGAAVYFITTAVFLLLGSGVEQEWNREEKPEPKKDIEGKVNEAFTNC